MWQFHSVPKKEEKKKNHKFKWMDETGRRHGQFYHAEKKKTSSKLDKLCHFVIDVKLILKGYAGMKLTHTKRIDLMNFWSADIREQIKSLEVEACK